MIQLDEKRARDLYAERDSDPAWRDKWAEDNPLARFAAAGRQRGWAAQLPLLADRFGPASDWTVLDVGVGSGGLLPWFRDEGGVPERRLAGIDLSDGRVALAREALPTADLQVGSAARLPWPDGSFDLVVASTLFSSVLDPDLRARIAAECLRVLKPGGAVLWYDMRDDFLGAALLRRLARPAEDWLGHKELARLFPRCEFRLRPATLFMPFARPLVRVSVRLAARVEDAMPFLRGHYQGMIIKPHTREER